MYTFCSLQRLFELYTPIYEDTLLNSEIDLC